LRLEILRCCECGSRASILEPSAQFLQLREIPLNLGGQFCGEGAVRQRLRRAIGLAPFGRPIMLRIVKEHEHVAPAPGRVLAFEPCDAVEVALGLVGRHPTIASATMTTATSQGVTRARHSPSGGPPAAAK